VRLVIATPPFLCEKRVRKTDYCTFDASEYKKWISDALAEAARIVVPKGHILLTTSMRKDGRVSRVKRVVFQVWQKRDARGGLRRRARAELFPRYFVDMKNFRWYALSIRLYQTLIQRYSRRGDIVAHIFSGSGNGGIAALQLARKPVLVDLHYHRKVERRLSRCQRGLNPS
jgi:DNA modification methylase